MVGDATGSVLGRGLAGYLIDALGWRSVFYLTVPLGLISLVGLLLVVPNRREPQAQTFDPLGLVVLAAFVVCLLVGLQSGAQDGCAHARVRTLLLLAGLALAAFVTIETLVSTPLIDLQLFRHRTYSLICLVSSGNIIGLMGAFLLIPLMLQRLLGLTPIHAGLILIPGAIAWGVVGPIGGKLSDRVDIRWLLMASFGLTIWTLLRVAAVTLETPAATLSWRVTCLFGAMALSFTPIVIVGMRTMPTASLRMGMGMMNLLRGLASVVGIAALSIVLEYRQRYHFQLLSQAQSQHPLEVAPLLDRLHSLFTLQGDWPEMVEHKALAVLNHRLHTEAAMQVYQECYLGLAFLYVLLFIPVGMLSRRYTVPDRTRLAEGETP
jgi:EmrB/QacA subfamily drug resistance transporter